MHPYLDTYKSSISIALFLTTKNKTKTNGKYSKSRKQFNSLFNATFSPQVLSSKLPFWINDCVLSEALINHIIIKLLI